MKWGAAIVVSCVDFDASDLQKLSDGAQVTLNSTDSTGLGMVQQAVLVGILQMAWPERYR